MTHNQPLRPTDDDIVKLVRIVVEAMKLQAQRDLQDLTAERDALQARIDAAAAALAPEEVSLQRS